MKLRKLELSDAIGMVEWMSDPDINKLMHFNPKEVSIEKAQSFIKESKVETINLHRAISDEKNQYLGTVSLKNIDNVNKNAEFAIAIRKCAMGKGISEWALNAILEIAFYQLQLHKVYLYVRTDNIRAIKFYEKCKLHHEGIFLEHYYIEGMFRDLKWYAIMEDEFQEWKNKMKRTK